MTGDPICGLCGREVPTLAPCPCGFEARCPAVGGVCEFCYEMVRLNAVNLRKERACRDRS